MGSVALGFSVIVGVLSLIQVVGLCFSLQQRDVSLWKIAGVTQRSSRLILSSEDLLVTISAGIVGTVASVALWTPYSEFVLESGLPKSDSISGSIPISALTIGIAISCLTCLLAGARASRKVSRTNVIDGLSGNNAQSRGARPGWKIFISALLGVFLIAGAGVLYRLIAEADRITDPTAIGDFLTSYPGMGMLLCVVLGFIAPIIVRALTTIFRHLPLPSVSYFLASREASYNIRVSGSLVTTISLAAVAVGVIMAWIDKLYSVLAGDPNSSVSAPPEQVILLLWGGVITGCVAAASLSFSTLQERRNDVALLLASGYTSGGVYRKCFWECLLYFAMTIIISYGVILINEFAMVSALQSGAVPRAEFSWPGWQGPAVASLGVFISSIILLLITWSSLRKSNQLTTRRS